MTAFDVWWNAYKKEIMSNNLSPAKEAWDYQQVEIAALRTELHSLNQSYNQLKRFR
jgi:hypothetical protein